MIFVDDLCVWFMYDLCDICAIVLEMQTAKQQWRQKTKINPLAPAGNRD